MTNKKNKLQISKDKYLVPAAAYMQITVHKKGYKQEKKNKSCCEHDFLQMVSNRLVVNDNNEDDNDSIGIPFLSNTSVDIHFLS